MWSAFTKAIADCSNARKSAQKTVETLLAILFQQSSRKNGSENGKSQSKSVGSSLLSAYGERKYLDAVERKRFVKATRSLPCRDSLFCLVLAAGGGRISETLALTPANIDLVSACICFETLKRRRRGVMRQVPMPQQLLKALDREFGLRVAQRDSTVARRRLWTWSRTTAWRRVKAVMATAGLHGAAAMPKGLRHAFGVSAFQATVPPHLVQRWLGHASLRTTAIYADVIGREERSFATRMWRRWS